MNGALCTWAVTAALVHAQPGDSETPSDASRAQPADAVKPTTGDGSPETVDEVTADDTESSEAPETGLGTTDGSEAAATQPAPYEPDPDNPWQPVPEDTRPGPVPSEAAAERQGPLFDSERTNTKKAKKKKFDRPYESPQRFALEIKLGPYLPNVDGRYDGPREFGPYAKIFGNTDARGITIEDPSQGLMAALAFEWQFLNPGQIGPLALGFQFSFFTDSARALFSSYANADNPDDVPEDVTDVRSEADSVRFTSFPLALQLVYRLEYFADRFRVPLVPYAKAGLGYAFWFSKGGDGSISVNSAGQKARGGVWGFQINAGGMLRLDFLERGTARTLDRATGINHTYIFGEYQFSQLDNFGRPSAISLGDSTFFVGLAMEF